MFKKCGNCKQMTGIDFKIEKCVICDKEICTRCSDFGMIRYFEDGDENIYHACSDDCSKSSYLKLIGEFPELDAVQLVNADNQMIGVTVDCDSTCDGIWLRRRVKDDVECAKKDDLIEELKPLYEFIKKDLEERGYKVVEKKESYI